MRIICIEVETTEYEVNYRENRGTGGGGSRTKAGTSCFTDKRERGLEEARRQKRPWKVGPERGLGGGVLG